MKGEKFTDADTYFLHFYADEVGSKSYTNIPFAAVYPYLVAFIKTVNPYPDTFEF